MFYILVIIGIISIALGIFLEKGSAVVKQRDKFIDEIYNDELNYNKTIEKDEIDKAKLLEKRIDILEGILFKKTLEEATKESIVLEDHQSKKETDSLEQYELIKQYEKENKSLDEISKLLNMNKGEVLLLKSLYKNL